MRKISRKRMKKSYFLIITSLFIFLLLFTPSTLSSSLSSFSPIEKKGHLILLAVSETEKGYIGKTADLYLEIQPGQGRVFMQTYPLSKIDTQISTRFANSIACKIVEKDCSQYDFFYTIKSDSSIIGGPSAGASIALLTMVLLNDVSYDDNIAMTGTINSGGIIGPVGAVKEKLEAASKAGIKTVIISEADIDENNTILEEEKLTILNITPKNKVNINDLEKQLGIKIIRVTDIYEAYYYFTGKKIRRETGEIITDDFYTKIMGILAERLCQRSEDLKITLQDKLKRNTLNDFSLENNSYYNEAMNLSEQAKKLFQEKKYYSAASRCYGASVNFEILNILYSNLTETEIISLINEVAIKIQKMNEEIKKWKINTITDLETYMIVQERLIEASQHISEAKEEQITSNITKIKLANAIERLYSATSWATYYGVGKVAFKLDKESVKQSCIEKITEAEEKIEYTKVLLNEDMAEITKSLELAYEDMKNEEYLSCLFKASKANAEASLVLSSIGLSTASVDKIIEKKLEVAKSVIYSQTKKGIFPILGYSYYEYAKELINTSKYSAMLYTEYAMELSNLDMYFKEERKKKDLKHELTTIFEKRFSYELIIFSFGFLMGCLTIILIIAFFIAKHNEKKIIKVRQNKRKKLLKAKN